MIRPTIYQYAAEQMKGLVDLLLDLSDKSGGFANPSESLLNDDLAATILFCGKGLHIDQLPINHERYNSWLSRSAIPFDIERAATGLLYQRLKKFTDELIKDYYAQTGDFKIVSADWIHKNPQALSVIMHVMGTFSRQELNKLVGPVSDSGISKPASQRVAALLQKLAPSQIPHPDQIRERIKATTEGIVRDLVGKLLLEEFVAHALRRANVPFRRESEYPLLAGVVYDFRADFVVPDEVAPKAFLEVRKSSSRHASLYAKDKMFSAINWKGKHQACLGILVVDGPWTSSSLQTMARVFDYVVPIASVKEVARKVRDYLDGDTKVLQWLIHFRVEKP